MSKMATNGLYNVNIVSESVLPPPAELCARVPRSQAAADTVKESRQIVQNILDRKDPRLLVVVGPCSVHDIKAAEEYAEKLLTLSKELSDVLFIVMRVYFEKPRTSVGWKGLINDPFMDDSFQVEEGFTIARKFLVKLGERKLPAGTEALDPVIPQYLGDLITWSAIGARTVESQTHREMASGLSTPVGFKNGTDGSIDVAMNALKSVSQPHRFLGINMNGQCAIFHTKGNSYGHLVLRGGAQPNYDSVHIALAEEALRKNKLPVNIMVDCSHGNSLKNPSLQPLVLENCVNQIVEGNSSIVGVMLESHLEAGNQPLPSDLSKLRYGVSITDSCLGWNDTVSALRQAASKLRERSNPSTK